MTKRHVTMIQNAYFHLLSDVEDDVPEATGLRRDYLRLCSGIKERGLRFITIDLVDAGKHFDKCLSASRLTPSGLPHQRPFKKGSVIPRLFKGLLLRVFDHCGRLHPVPCTRSIRHLRQLYNLAKKLKIECEEERTYETVRSFFRTDAGVLLGSLDWDSDCLGSGRARHLDYDDKLRPRPSGTQDFNFGPEFDNQPALQRYTVRAIHMAHDAISCSLGLFSPEEWRCKHGPGAVADRRVKSKYDFPS